MIEETGGTDELVERLKQTARNSGVTYPEQHVAYLAVEALTSLRAERDTAISQFRYVAKSNAVNFDRMKVAESSLAAEKLRVAELEQTFNMRWEAQQHAIKRWQDAHPGNDLVWPDHADLIVWLLGELEAARTLIEELKIARDREKDFYAKERDASADARNRTEALEQRVAALVGALTEIAGQRRIHEMDNADFLAADWSGGYDNCVRVARAALATEV